jgi:hypothetical protein
MKTKVERNAQQKTDCARCRLITVSDIIHLFLYTGFHGVAFLARIVEYNITHSFYRSFRSTHVSSQLYCTFPL